MEDIVVKESKVPHEMKTFRFQDTTNGADIKEIMKSSMSIG